ncbi:hypothetical protein [Candidatus Nitrotoga sp. M5]|uniref:hypothetical protein n=1 Tax=Candidatus Nitrotoga sp. M5 TaxID=2890409 RepID=UPI001EF37134|nr:hypothetical protein [Candidatus Nitrotoga sp. M5]CAH1385458.1 exported hypothetical protein [Candidatus Nitrotoga sp. M5]
MIIAVCKLGRPILFAIVLVCLCSTRSVFSHPAVDPDSNTLISNANLETYRNDELIKQVAWDFEQAMRRWSQGFFGALIYYNKTDGPLTHEFQDILKRDPDLPRIPVFHKIECISCDEVGECVVTVNIQFNTESTNKLRGYHLRNTGVWSPYSETTLVESTELRTLLTDCKVRNESILTLNNDKIVPKSIEDSEFVRAAFEKSMRTYRDEKWSNLLPLLAPLSRKKIREQLAKPNGEQELLKTGKLPENWKFECAYPYLSVYYVYARFANRNRNDNGVMKPFRFT